MSDTKAQHSEAEMEDEKGCCQPLCWIPIVMLFLCYALGLCCLFFFSTGGMVLCILHFVLGTILVLCPYAVHHRSDKAMAIAGIVGMSLYIFLIIATGVYSTWLLGQNGHADLDLYASDKRPLVSPLMKLYALQAGFSHVRRLDAVDGPVRPRGLQAIETHEVDGSMSPAMHLPKEGESHIPDSFFFPNAKHGEALSANQDQAEGSLDSLLSKEEGGATSSPKEGQDPLILVAQRKAGEILADSSENLNPTVLRQGPKSLADFKLTKSDMECLANVTKVSMDFSETQNRLMTLLNYGLFCGYTQYGLAKLHKWPLSCEKDCHFDKFHFSNIHKDHEKSAKQAYELAEAIDAMSTENAKFCTLLSVITSCRIGHDNLQYTAMGVMVIAVILCICLLGFGIKCIVVCASIIEKENKRHA